MQLSNAPQKLTAPFANAGSKNTIPVPSQIPITPGAASYTDGFPPLTMVAPSSGGVPPSGLDFNGIFYAVTGPAVWYSAGAGYPYDAVFSAAVGGYPKSAQVLCADGSGYWLSIADNNITNPDLGGAGWVPDSSNMVSGVYSSAQQSIAAGSHKILYDAIEFDSRGQWNAASHHFVALWPGKYRISGSTYLMAPSGQDFAADIYKNGVLAKRCSQFPQVSNIDISLPFSAVLSLAVGDYVEPYLNVSQAGVSVGISGSNEAYVYAQIEYMGQ